MSETPNLRLETSFPPSEIPIGARCWRPSPFQLATHTHEFFEIQLTVSGSITHVTAGGLERGMTPGDLLLMRPGAWHNTVDASADFTGRVGCFGEALLRRELGWTISDSGLNRLLWNGPLTQNPHGLLRLRLAPRVLPEAVRALDHLVKLTYAPRPCPPGNHAARLGWLTLLLGLIADAVPPAANPPAQPHPVVRQALQRLHANLAHPWEIVQLARELHINRAYLIRLFRDATGLPPLRYLHRARLEEAARRLVKTDDLVKQVGAAVGWDDPVLFARRFTAWFGVPPNEYRHRFGP